MKDKFFYIIFFTLVLIMARLIPHPPNFSPIIASAILAPMIIKNRYLGILITILAMIITDAIIGFHIYQLVIYLTIITISLFAPMKNKLSHLLVFSIGGSVWFFITTNFAVWLAWDYYTKDIEGLLTCYILALPFFTNTLISTILFTGILSVFVKKLNFLNEKTNYLASRFFRLNN